MITMRIKASCNPQDRIGGYFVSVDGAEYKGGAADTTVNRMELTAIIDGVSRIKKTDAKQHVRIVTKNRYVANGMKNFRDWRDHNFRTKAGSQAANMDLWDQLIKTANKQNVFLHVD